MRMHCPDNLDQLTFPTMESITQIPLAVKSELSQILFGDIDSPRFSNNSDGYLSRIGELVF